MYYVTNLAKSMRRDTKRDSIPQKQKCYKESGWNDTDGSLVKEKTVHLSSKYDRKQIYSINKGEKRGKFQSKDDEYILVSYSAEWKAYRLWKPGYC